MQTAHPCLTNVRHESVPKCPGCGAKFSHDSQLLACKACGITDETIHAGPRAIARWKRKPVYLVHTKGGVIVTEPDKRSKRQRKLARTAGRQRRRMAHGRAHV